MQVSAHKNGFQGFLVTANLLARHKFLHVI